MIIYNVEGAVGVGKTTFLNVVDEYINSHADLIDRILIVREPVEDWVRGGQIEGGDEISPLRAFYENPEENAALFQVYVFISRMEAIDRAIHEYMIAHGELPKVVFVERFGGYADDYVFVRILCQRGLIRIHQYEMYRRIIDLWRRRFPFHDHEHVILYLTAPFSVTRERIDLRNRDAERNVDMTHLLNVYNAYDRWLGNGTFVEGDNLIRVEAIDSTLDMYQLRRYVDNLFRLSELRNHF